jgi:aryl-alcohol dehydrogenase-like predicted oxidoreductase
MTSISSAQSGTFKIGGDIQINRLGFGAMRITGPGIWGEPADRLEAWVLKRSPVMLPIPGTSKVKHLVENVAAAGIKLSDEDFAALDRQGKQQAMAAAS